MDRPEPSQGLKDEGARVGRRSNGSHGRSQRWSKMAKRCQRCEEGHHNRTLGEMAAASVLLLVAMPGAPSSDALCS